MSTAQESTEAASPFVEGSLSLGRILKYLLHFTANVFSVMVVHSTLESDSIIHWALLEFTPEDYNLISLI